MDAKNVVAPNVLVASAVVDINHLKPQEEVDRNYSKSAVNYDGGNNETEEMTEFPHDDDEIFSLLMEAEDEDNDDDYDEDYFQTNVNDPFDNTTREKPLIERDESGLIKKIKIPVKKLGRNLNSVTSVKTQKLVKVVPTNLIDEKSSQQRSSTPLSREYMALQKSFNDSKILKEFVTDSSEKTRKVRAREQNSISTPTTPSTSTTSTDHSYTSRRRSNNNSLISPEKDLISPSIIIGQTKRHSNNKRFASLKAEELDTSGEYSPHCPLRSRSKSMHHSDNSNSSISHKLLAKWPSDESIDIPGGGKRKNMRSENVEFVQKQKDFLQHVINSTQDTPRRPSRSHSTGIELTGNVTQTKSSKYKEKSCKRIAAEFEADVVKDCLRSRSRSRSTGNASGVESTNGNPSQVKHHKSKERSSKRSKADLDDDNKPLSQSIVMECTTTTTDDHDDTNSVNNSINSTEATINTSSDVTTTTTDDAECSENHLKKVRQLPPKPGSDIFCWKCHQSNANLSCSKCIRSFHTRCANVQVDDMWICPDCTTVDNILNSTKRSRRNELSVDLLSQLLSFALNRMRQRSPKGNFAIPNEKAKIYKKVIVNPVHFGMLQLKIDAKEYRCTEEFVNDVKWMIHNSYILTSGNNAKTVMGAKAILKVCREELNEIDTCAECYLNANTRDDWFVDVCSQPHILLWAKLKGFPYWPAKAMGLGPHSTVNVHFFGQHDRAFVSIKDCFLLSVVDPNVQTGKKAAKKLVDCMKEVEEHIEKIMCKVGSFQYAPYKTHYDPSDEMKQLEEMMPGVVDYMKNQQVMRSKPSLQFKIYKTADNHLSIVQKASSTPELPTAQQQTEVDDIFPTTLKKKKYSSSSEEEKKTEGISNPSISAKYEVISKVTSDDSNSSKLSTVILKRKSANGDTKKTAEDEELVLDLPLPKMQKIEGLSAEDGLNNSQQSAKRKLEIGTGEKSKEKHAKQDHKIPVITIKTITTNKDLSKVTTEPMKTAKEVNVAIKEVVSVNPPSTLPAAKKSQAPSDTSASTQMVVEHVVKHKQGVTIKKILKDTVAPTISDSTTNSIPSVAGTLASTVVPATLTHSIEFNRSNLKESQNASPKAVVQSKECLGKAKSDEEKHREEQKVISILKGLVPFVEIKKEITSDNEEDPPVITAKERLVNRITPELPSSSTPDTTKTTTDAMILSSKYSAEEDTYTPPSLLTPIKDEVFSDEEQVNQTSSPITDSSKQQIALAQTEKSNISNATNEVRVVGGTTIQKISTKNSTQQSSVKRPPLKGIPHGPLPASAYSKICAESSSSSVQNDMVGTVPRAKKSFPQQSPTTDILKSATSGNGSTSVSVLTTSNPGHVNLLTQHLDAGKRSMAKTTMVAIPVDVAATTRTSSSMGTVLGSIPVPPLTAVSKTNPSTSAYNSIASRNTPGTMTVSGAGGSLSTAPAMSVKAATVASLVTPLVSLASLSSSTSTPTVLTSNLPITVLSNTATVSTASTTNTSTLTSTIATTMSAIATNTSNLANPLIMSAPPPLAGLSGLNLNSALPNGSSIMSVLETTAAFVPTTVAGTQLLAGPDTHILGGMVTPTLASAITDVICRGPPQLAARPNGPLQSDGHPMFPSQAGPVCKRLVDNAHKLTDFFISVMEDTMGEMALGDDASLQAKITMATLELERSKLSHEQQMSDIKRTSDLMLCEMRKSMENEKTRLVNETRKQCELEWKERELEWKRLVEDTKRKQWCAHCGREANFYCCWNTSYCDYPCQQLHWGQHASNCAQTRPNTQDGSSASNLQNATATQERHHGAKSSTMSSTSLITPSNVNTKALPSKKDKTLVNITSNSQLKSPSPLPTPIVGASSVALRSSSNPADVLKLPTNTYLRPVSASPLNNQTLRCNTTYSIPVQRYSLPITTPSKGTSNGPHTFTILHQGNSWVMSGANTGTSSSTVAAPIASVPQITQHRSSGTTTTASKSTKTQIRYH